LQLCWLDPADHIGAKDASPFSTSSEISDHRT
jgi:hypothetical protein